MALRLIKKIEKINQLIRRFDRSKKRSNEYTFSAMKNHILEIECLFMNKDKHWADETIDLLIHCLLLLQRNNYSDKKICEIFDIRCRKFYEKISSKLQ